MDAEDLADLGTDRPRRIERLAGILRYQADARAAQLTSVIDSMDSKAGSSAPTSGNSLSGEIASLPPAHTYHVTHMDFAQHWTF